MRYGTQAHLDYIKRRLQQKCRTKLPVTVGYVSDLRAFCNALEGKPMYLRQPKYKGRALGRTYTTDKHVLILIEKDMSFEIKAQTLVHEWAHAMTPISAPDHGRSWVFNYQKAYKVIFL